MAKAGYCAQCGANVWLREDGGCINGHDASQVSNVYEAQMPTQPAQPAPGSDTSAQIDKVADDLGKGLTEAGTQIGDFAKQAWAWGKQQTSPDQQTRGGSGTP
jgi:hypothetical protein